ncbi:MAG: TPR end-of-group domain-containing protein [Chloroflexota bacterium]
MAYLGQALSLQPQLVEWSKQDADLAPLRDDLDFQALLDS